MDNHRKLVMGALVLTVVATTASMGAYMSSVSTKSKAATREDIQKLVSDLKTQQISKTTAVPKFSVDKPTLRSAGTADLKTQAASVDKSKVHFEYTNTTGSDLKGGVLFLQVSGNSKFALGPVSGARPLGTSSKLKKGFVGYRLPELKSGQTVSVDVPIVVQSAGASLKVTPLIQVPGSRVTTAAAPVTIQAN